MRNLAIGLSLLVSVELSLAFSPPFYYHSRSSLKHVQKTVDHHHPPTRRRAFIVLRSAKDNSENNNVKMGLNELQTLLRDAVQKQDFMEAGTLSDELFVRLYGTEMSDIDPEEKRLKRKKMSWRGLGAAPWLVDRLDSLNYTFPTTIQINTMESVNQILNTTDETLLESTTLEERIGMNAKDMGIVVSGSTGSGKTLSFLVPLLSTLSDSLFTRQRLRVGAEESVGDTAGDLVERISVVTSPVVRTPGRKPIRSGTIATGAALSTLGKSGSDVKSPLALIVVPTRELGVQTAMLLYELVGGSLKKDPNDIRGKANMFKYKGPKGIRIGCVLDDEEAEFGLKLQTDFAITMPQYVGKLIDDKDLDPSKLRVVIFDEADLALEETPNKDLTTLFDDNPEEREFSRLTFMVGASVTESLGNLVVRSRILPEGKSYIATATNHVPLSDHSTSDVSAAGFKDDEEPKAASLKDLDVCLDPGLIHQRVTIRDGNGLLALTRLVRKELQDYDQRVYNAKLGNSNEDPASIPRPRVVAFFPDEVTARLSIAPLRDALWGEHKLCVLLPKIGNSPLQMMEQFKNEETSLMLATPNSVRGLDFPEVSHVYTLYLPMDDPREYVHLAGRVGRVGQKGSVRGGGGHVISILKAEDSDKMDSLSESLGFAFTDLEVPAESKLPQVTEDGDIGALNQDDLEKMKRVFEDTLNLVATDEDEVPEDEKVDPSSAAAIDVDFEDDDEIGFQ